MHNPLPPGQRALDHFPRFGVPAFADRLPSTVAAVRLQISGAVLQPLTIAEAELAALPRVTQRSDFHCVTTWTYRDALWSGFRFRDFFTQLLLPLVQPGQDIAVVIFKCMDGYRTALPLADLLAEDVLLADRLDEQPLPVAHGAPLRLVAPAHYGYKNPKHIDRIELHIDDRGYRPLLPRVMEHPRGRVAFEERGQLPGWFLRHLYRPTIRSIIARFRQE
jgi:DMSO/TMAO reductase YedYZ molybdopterin-dependent catalytic subunit